MSVEKSDAFIPYARQSIDDSDLNAVSDALKKPIITRGESVEAFEQTIAEYCGAEYAVTFNSGTTALQAACHVANVNPADRLITSPNTFVATANAALQFGASPIFVDIDRSSGNLNIDQVQEVLKEFHSSRGRSIIIPVHFSGAPVDMEALDRFIKSPNAVVIEDAAHAFGSTYSNGKPVGSCSWSQMTAFSFHPVKTITTGEGGAVTTNDSDLYHRLKRFRNNGIERDPNYMEQELANYYRGYYEVFEMTGNYHLTDIQAALGLSQFARMNVFLEKRRQLVAVYRKLFEGFPSIRLFDAKYDALSANHIFVVQVDFTAFNTSRNHVVEELAKRGIGTQVHYIPVYRHPYFIKSWGDLSEKFPEMETYFTQALTLPLYFEMQQEQVGTVVNHVKDILAEERQKGYRRGRSKR